jgi:hypothetical protein
MWSTPSLRQPYCGIAASFDPKTNVTYGWLRFFGKGYPNSISELLSCLKEAAPSMLHPLLPLTLIADHDIAFRGWDIASFYDELRIKSQSLFVTGTWESNAPLVKNLLQLPLPTILGGLLNDNVKSIACREVADSHAYALPLIRKAINETRKCVATLSISSSRQLRYEEISTQLEQKIDSMEVGLKSSEPRLQAIQKLVDMMLSAVGKLLNFPNFWLM